MKYLPIALLFISSLATAMGASDSERHFGKLRKTAVHLMNGSAGIVKGKSGRPYLLTNFHVCIDANVDGVVVGSFNDGKTVMGPVVEEDAVKDLCLVSLKDYTGEALETAEYLTYKETLYTRGWPQGILGEYEGKAYTAVAFDWVYTIDQVGVCPKGTTPVPGHTGRLSGCQVRSTNTITTIYAAPGSSGSPVVNSNGELVGVIESHLHFGSINKGQAGMVPLYLVKEFLKKH